MYILFRNIVIIIYIFMLNEKFFIFKKNKNFEILFLKIKIKSK